MPRGRPAKYPWGTWLNGQRHIVRQSPDWQRGDLDTFPENVKVSSFRAECHAAATRHGGKVDTKIFGNAVRIQFIETNV